METANSSSYSDLVAAPARIYILSRPKLDETSVEKFLNQEKVSWNRDVSTSEADLLTEFAGRVCYMSFGAKQFRKNNSEYISHLISEGHDSVLEHATWSFLLTGISRSFSHQLVRHRIGFSFSQLSQQYHDESDALFVSPPEIRQDSRAFSDWIQAMTATRASYRKLVAEIVTDSSFDNREKLRAVRSASRSVLPNCTETKIVVTANARSIRHFLDVRGSIIGDLEMREICSKLLAVFVEEAPSLFSDYFTETLRDGFPLVRRSVPSISE